MLNTFELARALKQGQHSLSAIVACSTNRVIGLNGSLPWYFPSDLAHFKKLTMGKYLVMGRKTMESIGKPLPGRTIVVLSRSAQKEVCGCAVIHNLTDWIQSLAPGQEIMIAGGGEIYEQLLPLCSKVYQTVVNHSIRGDTYFPELNPQEWLLEEVEAGMVGGQDTGELSFLTYTRRL